MGTDKHSLIAFVAVLSSGRAIHRFAANLAPNIKPELRVAKPS